MNPLDLAGPAFLGVWILGALVAGVVVLAIRVALTGARATPPSLDELQDRLPATELAYLHGGIERAIEAAVAGLHHRGQLAIEDGKLVDHPPEPVLQPDGTYRGIVVSQELSRVESYVVGRLGAGPETVEALVAGAHELDERLRAETIANGLWVRDPGRVRRRAAIPGLVWVGFGALKLFVGLSRGRPVGFLVLLLGLSTYVFFQLARTPRETGKARDLLARLGDGSWGLGSTSRTAPRLVSDADFMRSYALFGASILAGSELLALMPSHQRALLAQAGSGSTWFSSCGSSCSSCSSCSGCGGGCGGCGGCS